ncbi:TRP-domain-containing protein [Annulohypoxylon maeteangense]|uniref:TRP-domain-containing protein n=1 Tax=Annulohypoxylon maeteangense TaxID=1927788 RepID=UPI00200730D1|nr:TRP-domain-containing protein [Annulohypoxylon maeteangense]KAI0886075.1 TRP-domain-containing protein [Annulohypoxylon maeteangense]
MLHYLRLNSLILLTLRGLTLLPTTCAKDTHYISGTSLDGITTRLALDRTPALYTGDFGDCLGGQSLLNVTKFDAAFYYDNSTILFHLDGTTNIRNESIMLYISVEAYGESRFSMTVNPCNVNIYSMCPLSTEQPVEAFALFPIGPQQVSGIPQIAYEVPDIEGYARIQIFANSSQTEIGCFQAVMRNGNSFSQPKSVSAVLGIFTAVAIIASFATAAYGVSIPHMRSHYAHSLSILVIFETFQSIFFSGALSLPWPSVLPAWWSNFAWAAGLISSSNVVRSLDIFVGVSGNASQVGGAGSTIINNQGGLTQQIYGRSLMSNVTTQAFDKRVPETVRDIVKALARREPYNPNDPYDYNWNGDPVQPGMPLPGDWTGFAGELAELGIPGPNAFMVGIVWLLVALGLVVIFIVALKYSLEGLAKMRWIKQDRLEYFRFHWTGYLSVAILRTLFLAFFSIATLAMFQFSVRGSAGPTSIAAIVFVIFILGIGGLVLYALHFRLRFSTFSADPDRILLRTRKIFGRLPCVFPVRISQLKEEELGEKPVGSWPFIRCHFVDNDPNRKNIHQDEEYIKRFGWLSARYRLSRWWFFAFWLAYQFVRACFLGGGAGNPLAQVFGLFIVDILAFVIIAALNPYEGQRNTALAVWLLGLTRVATTGLSIAFLPDFNLSRIVATVIGVIIIVIQGLLTIAVMILIIIGGISSWMSLSRNREYFSSEMLEGVRIRYFEHIAQRATDETPPPKSKSKTGPKPDSSNGCPELPKEPYFTVTSVRRAPKIEDEGDDYLPEINSVDAASGATSTPSLMRRAGRSTSISSRHSASNLPRGARVHRASWSPRDFSQGEQLDQDRPTALAQQTSDSSGHIGVNSPNIAAILQGQPFASNLQTVATITGSKPFTKEVPEVESGLREAEEIEKDAENACLEDSQ